MKSKIDGRSFNRKKKQDLRVETIQVLLNEEEKIQIVSQAKQEGLPISTYIRWKLLRKQS